MNRRAWIPVLVLLLVTVLLGMPATHGAPPAPKEVFELHDTPISSNADVCTTSLSPSLGTVAYRITIGLVSTNSVVNMQVNPTGTGTTRGYDLNSGTALTAGNLYTFTLGAADGATFNVQCETGTTIGYLLIEEILDGAL